MQALRITLVFAVLSATNAGHADAPASQHFFLLDLRGDGLALGGSNKTTGTRWTTPQTDDAFLAVDATGLRGMGIDVTSRDRLHLDGTVLVSTNVRLVVAGQSREIERTWQMLAGLDTNRDGRLDNRDLTWAHLRVFVDTDADGRIQATEVHGTNEASIASIATKPGSDPRTDAHGNVITESWLTTMDGRMRKVADVGFGVLIVQEHLATR